MHLRRILAAAMAVVATALFVATGYASAATITILQTNDNDIVGPTPAAPAGFTLLNLGTGSANVQQTTSGFAVGGVTFSFSGGSPASGEYAGNVGGQFASPFGAGNSTTNYIVGGGSGGSVNVTWATTQNELHLLWGTIDPEFGRNLITIGATQITGAQIIAAIGVQAFSYFGDGDTDTYLKITGLPNFTSATFSDSGSAAFEFVLGVAAAPVPGPIVGAGLPGLVLAAGSLLAFARRRRQTFA